MGVEGGMRVGHSRREKGRRVARDDDERKRREEEVRRSQTHLAS